MFGDVPTATLSPSNRLVKRAASLCGAVLGASVGLVPVGASPAGAVPIDDGRADLYVINMNDNGRTAIHALDGASAYSQFTLHALTPINATAGGRYSFAVSDYNGDRVSDLYMFDRNDEGSVAVHVLDGQTDYSTFLLQSKTALHSVGGHLSWELKTGDFNLDGRSDVYAINRNDPSGSTSVHVLDAGSGFTTFLAHEITPLHPTNDPIWALEVGDFNGDGYGDVYAMHKNDHGATSVHVLDGANRFQVFTSHVLSAMHATDDPRWLLRVGDYDGDGRSDLYAFNRDSNGNTDAHAIDAAAVSSAASGFQNFSLHAVTAMHDSLADVWDLQLTGHSPRYPAEALTEGQPDPTDDLYYNDRAPIVIAEQPAGTTLELRTSSIGSKRDDIPKAYWAACGNFDSKFQLVKSYVRLKLHPRMVGPYADFRCGLFDPEPGYSVFGRRHVEDRHLEDWENLGNYVQRSWIDIAAWAMDNTALDPDTVVEQSYKRFCYDRTFGLFRSNGEKITEFRAILILGETGRRVMTFFPSTSSYKCIKGPNSQYPTQPWQILYQVGSRVD
jgi:hypothetical protein